MNREPGSFAVSYRTGLTGKTFILGLQLFVLLLVLLPRAESAERVSVSGKVMFGDTPLCAMVLANGQNMFSCNKDLGRFSLEVPLDNSGNVTLFAFVSGFQPFKIVFPAPGGGGGGGGTGGSNTLTFNTSGILANGIVDWAASISAPSSAIITRSLPRAPA